MVTLHHNTPTVTVLDSWGQTVREIAYHRHPDSPHITETRITRHQSDARGRIVRSSDPRLYAAGRTNFISQYDLNGNLLRSDGADNGTTTTLNDAAGRPLITVSNIRVTDDGTADTRQAVTRTWQYEPASLPGRLLGVTEQLAGDVARITERFVYAGNTDAEKALNLAGACISHYDTAGLVQTDSVALTGVPLAVTRRLLQDADNPDTVVDWQGEDVSAWNDRLATESFTTLTTTDATGATLTTTDAKGHMQRVAYDVAGLLSGSWLTLKGGTEQVVVKSLAYSAAGQKLREEHGNGVVTTYTYEPETQRLTGIKTERPAGHVTGARVLQDLRYKYDPVGNVLSIRNDAEETRFWRNQKVLPFNEYVYDSLYQLVRASGREMANVGQQGKDLPPLSDFDNATYTNYTRIFTYDNAGNLTQIRHAAPATNNNYTTSITISHSCNRGVLDDLSTIPSEVDTRFTAGGQMKNLQQGQLLSWTPRNELRQVASTLSDGTLGDYESYRYGLSGQRILKISAQQTSNNAQIQRIIYLPGLELHTRTNGNKEVESLQLICMNVAGNTQVRVLFWVNGRPESISNGQVRYSYGNSIGSCNQEVDDEGKLINQDECYPFGGVSVRTSRNTTEVDYKAIRYSGKERDATGLYYYGHRYYIPWMCRWLSPDPIGNYDGNNLYSMVGNNPTTFIDTDGLIRTYIEDGIIYTSSYSVGMSPMFQPSKDFVKSNLGRKKIKGKVNNGQTTGVQLIAAGDEGDRVWGPVAKAKNARNMSASPVNNVEASWGHQIAKRWGGPGELWNASSATNERGVGNPAQEDFQSILEEAIDGTKDSPAHSAYNGLGKIDLSRVRIKHTAYYYDNAGTQLGNEYLEDQNPRRTRKKYPSVDGPGGSSVPNEPTVAKFMRLKVYVDGVKVIDQTAHENAQRLDASMRNKLMQMYISAIISKTALPSKNGTSTESVLSNSFSRGDKPGKPPYAMRAGKVNELFTPWQQP